MQKNKLPSCPGGLSIVQCRQGDETMYMLNKESMAKIIHSNSKGGGMDDVSNKWKRATVFLESQE